MSFVSGVSSADLNPIDFPEEWDAIYVGGVRSPGVAELTEPKRANEWDIKRGKGARGATITYTGDVPAEFRATFRFWTREHFTAWAAYRALLKYDPTKKDIQAIDIAYPSLADLEISSVVTKSIGGITREAPGLYAVVVEFLEFRTPSSLAAVGTPATSTAGGGANGAGQKTGTQPDPIAEAQQKEIARLLTIAEKP